MENAVWYAAYGSNVSRRRLLTYLRGGTAPGAARPTVGAADPAAPRADAPTKLPFPLYFARRSATWGGGVAFVDHHRVAPAPTLGRRWLLSEPQFLHVLAAENGRPGADLGVTAAELADRPATRVCDGWYGTVLRCDPVDGVPVLTFTATRPAHEHEPTAPTAAYVATLAEGLSRSHRLATEQLVGYLLAVPGVTGRWDAAGLRRALSAPPG